MSSPFDKIEGCVLHFKTLVQHRLFYQKEHSFSLFIPFKAASFQYIFQKEYVANFLYRKVAGLLCYWKKLHHRSFPEKFQNFRNQLFSVTYSFVLKKQITWQITWKRDDSSAFLHSLISSICWKVTPEMEQYS